jgi:MFS family permease
MVRSRRHINAAKNGLGRCIANASTDQTRAFENVDVGIVVYRDHPTLDDVEDNEQNYNLSIDTNDDDHDGNNHIVYHSDDNDDDNSAYDSRHNDNEEQQKTHSNPLLSSGNRQHQPIYTPQIFISHPHLAVLPVILLEFLSLAVTRAVLPSLLLQRYGSKTYIIMGLAECVRGILAFLTCPMFGKLSDIWGRRPCLLMTVLGTLAPVCSLAFWKVNASIDVIHSITMQVEAEYDERFASSIKLNESNSDHLFLDGIDAGEATEGQWYSPNFGSHSDYTNSDPSTLRIDVFVILLALSGMCSSTFTLTFAYISDVVKDRDGRVAAYGLALATFGLSFTIGPLLGGYLANVDNQGHGHGGRNWMRIFHLGDETGDTDAENDHQLGSKNSDIHPLGQHRVFLTSLCLALFDLFYIHFLLPESLNRKSVEMEYASSLVNVSIDDGSVGIEKYNNDATSSTAVASSSGMSNVALPAGMGVSRRASSLWWNPFDSVRYLTTDPLLSTIGRVTFFYYTALHAVVSTLILYATRQFHLGPQRLGELMAALGLSTMISEAVLVRIAIPLFGETRCMRIGLASFTLQCILLAVANSPWQLFICAFLAMGGNLVYPSVSSLVSSSVRPDMVGRALGAVNGVKSLTEGIGPLIFGTVSSEHCCSFLSI